MFSKHLNKNDSLYAGVLFMLSLAWTNFAATSC